MADLSKIEFIKDKDNFSNKEKIIENTKLKLVLNENGICVELIVSEIIEIFKVKSEFSTKQFYKISKGKNTEKKILNFITQAILPIWVRYIEKDNIYLFDLRDNLDTDVFKTYIAGIYIVIHSKSMESNLNQLLELILVEMFYMGIKKIKESGKI